MDDTEMALIPTLFRVFSAELPLARRNPSPATVTRVSGSIPRTESRARRSTLQGRRTTT